MNLLVVAGPDKGQSFPMTDGASLLLGRSKQTTGRLNDPAASRVHCEIELKGRVVSLTDLDSAGGTFVNGKRVSETQLKHNDLIKIGGTELRLVDPAGPAAPLLAKPVVQPKPLTWERLGSLTGTKLSHFEVGQVIGTGKSGLVFKANDFKNERVVALKIMRPDFSKSDDEMQRFIRAVKTMMPLRHPNLVALYGAGKTSFYCWISMEYVEGKSLAQIIDQIGTAGMLDWRITLSIAIYLAQALEYAHSQGIIHRNITPQNVLVGSTPGVLKLGDLMLAKALDGVLAQDVTKPGEILGDVRYSAPERYGGSEVDGRSDIYSLGALTYALLTGKPPFVGKNPIDILMKIRSEALVPPKQINAAVPDLLQGLVVKMLARKPEDRHQKAGDLLKDLNNLAKIMNVNV